MAIFLLDTDMLSLHQRNQSQVIAAVGSPTVVTRNLRDFGRVPGLMIEEWAT